MPQEKIDAATLSQVKYPGFQRSLGKRKYGTSGSARHPVAWDILGYSVIDQILAGDPHFYNTMFGSILNSCEKLRPL